VGKSDPKHVQQTKQINDDTDIFELIIFDLSPVLGGRDNVLATPFIEAVKHYELHQRKKKSDRWNGFMDRAYADFTNGIDKLKRQKYIETIQPEQARKNLANNKTDLSQLERMKAEQMKQATDSARQSEQGG
jgi:hypothetical protein